MKQRIRPLFCFAHHRHKGQRALRSGMSLVELALVILILGLLLTVVFGVVNGIVNISTQSSPSREAKRQAFFVLQNIKSSIDQAYYRYGHKRIWFVGKKDGFEGGRRDRLTFCAVHPGSEVIGAAAVREVSFYLKEEHEDGSYTLTRREDLLVDENPGKGGPHYPLLKNVSSFELQYSLDNKDWLDEWDSRKRQRLPLGVLVSFTILLGEREYTFKAFASPGLNKK